MRGPPGCGIVSEMIHGRQVNPCRKTFAALGATVALPVMMGFAAHFASAALPLVAPSARQSAAAADDAATAPRPRMFCVARLATPGTLAAGPLMTDDAFQFHLHCVSDWGKAAIPFAVQRPRPRAAHLPMVCFYLVLQENRANVTEFRSSAMQLIPLAADKDNLKVGLQQ